MKYPAALLAMLSLAGAANAADFTFNVPVALHKIPSDVSSFSISAVLYDGTWDKTSGNSFGHRVEYGNSANIPIQNGEYTGTVTVTANTRISGRSPSEAVYYQVNLLFVPKGGCLNVLGKNTETPYDASKPIRCDYIGTLNSVALKPWNRAVPRLGRSPQH